MKRALVVHADTVFRGLVEGALRRELGENVQEECVAAYGDVATELPLDMECRIAVIDAAAPAERRSGPDNLYHAAAKAFLSDAVSKRPDIVVLVLATENDDSLCRVVKSHPRGRLAIVSPSSGWMQIVRESAREAFGMSCSGTLDKRRTRTVLRIVVTNRSQGLWTMERRGPVQANRAGTLNLDPVYFHDLCVKSEGLLNEFKNAKWGDCLPPVANDLYRAIFMRNENLDLQKAFNEAMSDPGGAEKMRMVFGLSADLSMLPVETLKRYEPASNAEQWYALKSAILRQYEGEGPLQPLFWDLESRKSDIDCLLIAAASRRGMGLPELPQVNDEIDEIAKTLSQQRAAGANIGRVEVLKLGDNADGQTANQRLRLALSNHGWKLVHFAGHAAIVPGQGDRPPTGHLVLDPPREEVVGFADFARNIPNAQFLFVSSCRSANQAFLEEVIRQSIPAVLGYRWPVVDDQARHLAVDFYRSLVTPTSGAYRSLGRALAHARKQVFGLDLPDVTRASPTWASPILLAKGSRQGEPPELHASLEEPVM